MKLVNWVLDRAYDFFEYMLMVIILVIAIFVIMWRLDSLFDTNLEIFAESERRFSAIEQNISNHPLYGESIEVIIPKGTSAEGIANILYEFELIKDRKVFMDIFANSLGSDNLPSGTFNLEYGYSNEKIVKELLK